MVIKLLIGTVIVFYRNAERNRHLNVIKRKITIGKGYKNKDSIHVNNKSIVKQLFVCYEGLIKHETMKRRSLDITFNTKSNSTMHLYF